MADILSHSLKLLKKETIEKWFTSQFYPGSAAQKGLEAWSLIFASMTVGVTGMAGANYGLGGLGLLLTESASGVGIPKNTLMWGAFTNPVWQMNREKGIAGWIGVQQ